MYSNIAVIYLKMSRNQKEKWSFEKFFTRSYLSLRC